MGNKRHRNKVEPQPELTTREQTILQLKGAGFSAETFPDSQLALFALAAGLRSDLQGLADCIDEFGAMVEDYLAEPEGEGGE